MAKWILGGLVLLLVVDYAGYDGHYSAIADDHFKEMIHGYRH